MILNNVDIEILRNIFEKKETTTWDIANSYNWEDKPNNMDKSKKQVFYSAKTNLIEYRIKRLAKEGLIKIEKNDEEIFRVDEKRVMIKRVRIINGIKINSYCLFVKGMDNKFCIFQI